MKCYCEHCCIMVYPKRKLVVNVKLEGIICEYEKEDRELDTDVTSDVLVCPVCGSEVEENDD